LCGTGNAIPFCFKIAWLMVLQRRPTDNDERVVLFVLMKPGKKFAQGLVNDIKAAIRKELSPRHVPKYIFETPEIPVSMTCTGRFVLC
jgi:acetoacetyl-CoA synthetase